MSGETLSLDGNSWKFLHHPDTYCESSRGSNRPLEPEPTRRQFTTAKAILSRLSGNDTKQVGGVLLADDVGLGKTTVAALVAWVVAGREGTVRILAPNAVLRRRWEEELKAHVPLLQARAPSLAVDVNRIKGWETERLRSGRIQVGTHHQLVMARREGLLRTGCDLLIVDEAHRAKGEESAFREALEAQGERAAAKLILTATPFSIAVDELIQLLGFCGAQDIATPVRRYAQALLRLHEPAQGKDPGTTSEQLKALAKDAIEAIAPYVIRHGIDDLPTSERSHFGKVGTPWSIDVPAADEGALELLLRADRLLRLTRDERRERTNDPRFHVGWKHLVQEVERVEVLAKGEVLQVVRNQLQQTRKLLRTQTQGGPHPKMAAVAKAVTERVAAQEKVLLFCHHRATALELLQVLDTRLRLPADAPQCLTEAVWRQEWRALLASRAEERPLPDTHTDAEELRETFLAWLCGPGLRRQVLSWLPESPRDGMHLRKLLAGTRVRGRKETRVPFVADAADALFRGLTDARSRSTLGLLRAAYRGDSALPGDLSGGHRVLGSWTHSSDDEEAPDILFQGEPDVVLGLFNSPFGPDVLVATDRLSEGVDLHRCCRLLVHYELDPSPIRTLQRNGRVRRVGGWAGLTAQSIEYAYPSFNGTRDARAVEIMNRRLQRFDLLLGGVPPVSLDEDEGADDAFVRKVLELCGDALKDLNKLLRP
ncbi:DEAD/DEAH box helicase [Corallococcus sp. CA053C]|uniref:SNF2-related protein n=1 Tax=Corallococcus sp. CA053C TaxID=2316732 RepID=UPI000EA2E54B|nr:SNF2-related protein [Corallococcus sp. CA053C]RKH05024.1 DEAD/DEAH box helicase [Corallococcus sp. CA053C]